MVVHCIYKAPVNGHTPSFASVAAPIAQASDVIADEAAWKWKSRNSDKSALVPLGNLWEQLKK